MGNYLATAKVLDNMILDLKSRQIDVPASVVDSLKIARSLASIILVSPDDTETMIKAQATLESVGMNLLSIAEAKVNREYADAWQTKIDEADTVISDPPVKKTTFVSGVPKGERWIRFETKDLAELSDAEQLLTKNGLKTKINEDGFTLIYGRNEDIKAFMNEVREEYHRKNEKGGV